MNDKLQLTNWLKYGFDAAITKIKEDKACVIGQVCKRINYTVNDQGRVIYTCSDPIKTAEFVMKHFKVGRKTDWYKRSKYFKNRQEVSNG